MPFWCTRSASHLTTKESSFYTATADAACQVTIPTGGDTCADVEEYCSKITPECCPECGTELTVLETCGGTTPGDSSGGGGDTMPTSGIDTYSSCTAVLGVMMAVATLNQLAI